MNFSSKLRILINVSIIEETSDFVSSKRILESHKFDSFIITC